MTGKREKTKQINRAIILAAARNCFIDRGYEAVTVRDIIRETNLAPGTFYNYFADKAAVYNEILDNVFAEVNSDLMVMRENAATFEEEITNGYRMIFSYIDKDPHLMHFVLSTTPTINDLHNPSRMWLSVNTLLDHLKKSAVEGVIPNEKVEFRAAAAFGIASEIGRTYAAQRIAGEPAATQEVADFATQVALRGFNALA